MPIDEPTRAVPEIANVAGTTGPPTGSTADLQASDADATLDSSSTTASRGPNASFPASIGAFQIQRLLGEGGMGAVYLAVQENPRRQVALKVIRGERLSPSLLARFELETAALARLQHPGIAQIFEAGTAESVPYFAMEYVAGKSLTSYADEQNLNTRWRLELLIKICAAVEHAHQKGIIHRDLKPGNIIVDAAGEPKILDFGIARATDADLSAASPATSEGQLVGTLPYMSPEQAIADPTLLDTRSDVYTLGVIGYELLSGRLPHDLVGKSIPEAVRTIIEDEPPPLASVDKSLRGDLSTIVAKALEKDKARRYQSAADFARDLERYLRDEPILARPASAWYQVSKFARRNRMLVGSAAAVLIALVAGLGATTAAMVYAQEQEAEARAAETARAASQALALGRAAELSARQGDWGEALKQYAEALELPHADSIGLRIGKLRCLLSLNRNREAADEIAALSKRDDLGKYAGQVLLQKAWLADAAGSGVGDAAALRHEALEKGLSPADAAFARSFDAQTFPEAILKLEEAVRHDPYHHLAHERLFMLYFVSGRTDDAKQTLAQLRLLSPRSAFVVAGQAVMQALAGDQKQAEASLGELERLGGQDDAAIVRPVVALVAKSLNRSATGEGDSNAVALLREFWNVSSAIVKNMGLGSSSVEAASGTQMFNYPLFGKILKHVGAYLTKDTLFMRSAAADEWGEIAKILPESNVLNMHAMLLMKAGRLADAERVLLAAIAAPSAVNSQRGAYLNLIDVQWQLGTANGMRNEELLAKARDNVRKLQQYAPLNSLELLISTRVASEDRDPTLALALLDEWGRLQPDEFAMLNYRSMAEFKLGAYERAYRTMGRMLELQGDDLTGSIGRFRALALYKMRGELDPGFDWLSAAKYEIENYAKTARLTGGEEDANAAPWAEKVVEGSPDQIDGVWQARLCQNKSPDNWFPFGARVSTMGDRVTIELISPTQGSVLRRIVARREGQRLVGWQANSIGTRDAWPWVGQIVDGERIDGIWHGGRIDLRRSLNSK